MVLPALLRTLVLAAALLPLAARAAPVGLVTIVDGGEVAVLRDTQRFAAAEGLRLNADDIVRTGPATKLARLELSDGSTLDLGASTELLLRPGPALGRRATLLYLLRGWLKVGAGEAAGAIATPQAELSGIAGNVVLRVAPQSLLVFAEGGSVEVGHHLLGEGDAWVQRAGEAGTALRRPPAGLMEGLPRGFVDSLPRRSARFEKAPVEPGHGEDIGYAEVAAWLNAEAPLRSAFVPRFAARARDREFRAGLVADLRAHPEWDRTLFPEKYRPKPVAAAKHAAQAASAPPAVVPVAVDLHGLMSWPGAARPAEPNPPAEER